MLFARSFFANPRHVGSVIPSSRRLIERLLGHTEWAEISVAVEYGPGTGVVTRALLARLGPDARLYAFEIDDSFVDYLRQTIDDPRLIVVAASAEGVAGALNGYGHSHCDVVVSSLPFSIMPIGVRSRILQGTASILSSGASFIGYQYSTRWLHELRHVFRRVAVEIEPRNWPPAFVFRALAG